MRSLLILKLLVLTACASTGATFRSGVGDTYLEHPPWYAGRAAAPSARIVHLPVAYQRGGSHAAFLDPTAGVGSAVGDLVAEMNRWLAENLAGVAAIPASRVPAGVAPDVQFGCEQFTGDECDPREEEVLGRRGTTLRLAVGRPSADWIAGVRAALDTAQATHALVITLEVGQYLTRQTGVLGKKHLELGTGYTMSQPWLTSLETPVSVLQITGALVNRDGKAVRIGAEGIMARRTSLAGSAIGLQRILRDEDVVEARHLRRDELPGSPLAWQVALRHLVEGLVTQAGT
jgi:hypothetical protein